MTLLGSFLSMKFKCEFKRFIRLDVRFDLNI